MEIMKTNRIRVVLLALTGFGNDMLAALLARDDFEVGLVLTQREPGPFPYYELPQLTEECEKAGVAFSTDSVKSPSTIAAIRDLTPDLLLVASFREMIPEALFLVPRLGAVNVHPSLLPRHRGPCPFSAAILSGDADTGVSYHLLSKEADAGDVVLRRGHDLDERITCGGLRRSLSKLAAEMLPDLAELCRQGTALTGSPQDHSLATFAPRPALEELQVENCRDVEAAKRLIRAFSPYPLARVRGPEGIYSVTGFGKTYTSQRRDGLYYRDGGVELARGGLSLPLKCSDRIRD